MNLFLNRDNPVPLHDQLVAQIGQLVASGALTPGQRLPSIRGLAARLGIHHQTVLAAYKSLAERGVVVIQAGSGARVADWAASDESWRDGLALRAMAAYFVAQARAHGHDEAAILAACREAVYPAPIRRLVVVNPHPDLLALYLHELGERLDFPMVGMTLEDVAASSLEDACVLTSTNHASTLQSLMGEGHAPMLLKLAPLDRLLAQARALPPDAVVGVVSRSERFRFLIPEMLAGTRGEGQILSADAEDADRLGTVLRLSALIVTDAVSHAALSSQTRAPVHALRLIADDVLRALAERLPPEAFRPAKNA